MARCSSSSGRETRVWVAQCSGVSFEPQGTLLRVYDCEGKLIPLASEFAAIVIEHERQLAEQQRQNAEQDRRLAELEAELRRLRG